MPADNEDGRACQPAARLLQDRASRYRARAFGRVDGDAFSGITRQRRSNGVAVSRADELFQALDQRACRVGTRELNGFADVPGDARRQFLDRGLDGIRSVNALGNGRRDLL